MATKIWAHRGSSYEMPENSLEAFKLARKQKADGIELDVQLTKDGRVVVIHDEFIDNLSDGKGLVNDFTLEELKKFNFNNKHPKIDRVEILTLDEVYEYVAKTDLLVNVELKTLIYPNKGLVKAVLDLEEKFKMQDRVIYSSFNHETVVKIKQRAKKARTALLVSDGYINVSRYASKLEVDYLHPAVYLLRDEDFVKKAKRRDLKLNVWTVDDEKLMKYLMKQKVNGIITNRPDLAYAVREKIREDK